LRVRRAETIFAEAQVPLESALYLFELGPQCPCFFEDGSQLDMASGGACLDAVPA